MNSNLKVSIITVCFNSEKTIADTIQSVMNQTYPYLEHIIVDGCSTDKTVEIIRSYNEHLTCIDSTIDYGLCTRTLNVIGAASTIRIWRNH